MTYLFVFVADASHICIYASIYADMLACMQICSHVCIYANIHVDMLAYMQICPHNCLYANIYAYILAYMKICWFQRGGARENGSHSLNARPPRTSPTPPHPTKATTTQQQNNNNHNTNNNNKHICVYAYMLAYIQICSHTCKYARPVCWTPFGTAVQTAPLIKRRNKSHILPAISASCMHIYIHICVYAYMLAYIQICSHTCKYARPVCWTPFATAVQTAPLIKRRNKRHILPAISASCMHIYIYI